MNGILWFLAIIAFLLLLSLVSIQIESFRGGRGHGGRGGRGGRRGRRGGRYYYGGPRHHIHRRHYRYPNRIWYTAPIVTYPVYNTWSDYFYNPWRRFMWACKNGCTSIGNGQWGCQYPGNGPNDCVFATDCYGCGV